jgi:hypothetical protein
MKLNTNLGHEDNLPSLGRPEVQTRWAPHFGVVLRVISPIEIHSLNNRNSSKRVWRAMAGLDELPPTEPAGGF